MWRFCILLEFRVVDDRKRCNLGTVALCHIPWLLGVVSSFLLMPVVKAVNRNKIQHRIVGVHSQKRFLQFV